MTVSLRQLRVSAEMDAGSYVAGAKALEQSSASAGKAVTGLGNTVKQTDSKVGTSGNMVERLNKRFIDGYASALQFEKAVNMVGRALDTGQIDMAHAERLLIGISNKYQQTANAADILAAGQYDLAQAVTSANAVIETSSNVIDFNTAAKVRNIGATRNVAAMNRNLMFQLVDIGQALATAPTMGIYALQNLGFQFAQIGQLYAGQGGFKQAFTDSLPMIGRFAAKLAPVAIVAGAVAAAFAGMQYEIREATGVSVGFGDVVLANLQVVGQAIYDFLQPAINAIAPWFAAAWELIVAGFKGFNNTLIRLGVGAFETIRFGVATLPSAFIAAAEGAANGFVTAINWMVERTVAGFNAIIDAANYVSDKLGMGDVVDRFDASSYQVGRFDFGGKAALDEVRKQAEAYNEEMKAIAERDYLGRYFDAVADQSIVNYNKRMDEAKKKTKSAMSEAEKALQQFLRTADQLVEKHFPGQAAAAEAEALIRMLDEMGDALTDIQRTAVELEIDELFKKAAGGADEAAKAIEQTLGSVLSDLFSKPIEDLDDFLDRVMSGFAELGRANLSRFFDGMLTGGNSAANDNQPNPWAMLRKAVQQGAAVGTAEGAAVGTAEGLSGLGGFSQSGGSGALKSSLSAGLGGFGMGYESGSPLMGGIGGALSGFMAGGPIGAIVGGLAGLLGGIFGGAAKARRELEAAQHELDKLMPAIDAFNIQGRGGGLGQSRQAFLEFQAEGQKLMEAALKAKDFKLEDEIEHSIAVMERLLKEDFVLAFEGTIDAMRAGLGSNSPFAQAQANIMNLREELKNFIADAQWAGANVEEARKATQAFALAALTGAEVLSPMQAEMQRLSGTASALQNTLQQLGMSSGAAEVAIRDGLAKAIGALRDSFNDDINASINELSGKGFRNEIKDALDLYSQRYKDMDALGLSGSGLRDEELTLALVNIAKQSGTTAEEIGQYALSLNLPSYVVGEAMRRIQEEAERAERLQGLWDAIGDSRDQLFDAINAFKTFAEQIGDFRDSLRLNSALSTLSPQQRFDEARRQFEQTADLALGGDREAMQRLQGVSQTYLEEARSFYASSEQYAAIFDDVDTRLAAAQEMAIHQVDVAEQELSILAQQVDGLDTVNDSVLSVRDALDQLSANVGAYLAAGGSAAGFASGGYTGDIGRNAIAGVVHGQEFVAHAEATRRWRPQLEAMNAGRAPGTGGGSDRENFRELGRMISAAVAAQTDVLKAENAGLRDELRKLKEETRIAGDKQARLRKAS